MLRGAFLVALAAAASLGVASSAGAHTDPAVESWVSAPAVELAPLPSTWLNADVSAVPEPWGPLWPVLLLAALAPTLGRRRAGRVVAALLVVLVGVLTVETAVHSVHHGLADERVACPTASAATHVHGTTAGLAAIDSPILRVCLAPAVPEPLVRALRPVDSQHDRAPPSALA